MLYAEGSSSISRTSVTQLIALLLTKRCAVSPTCVLAQGNSVKSGRVQQYSHVAIRDEDHEDSDLLVTVLGSWGQ